MYNSILAFLLLATGPALVMSEQIDCEAKVVIEQNANLMHIGGEFHCDKDFDDSLRFELSVDRQGNAGKSRTSQAGYFETGSEQADSLGSTRVNVQSGDMLYVTLKVYEGDLLIALEDTEEFIDEEAP